MRVAFAARSRRPVRFLLAVAACLLLVEACAAGPAEAPAATAAPAAPPTLRQEVEQAYERDRRALMTNDLAAILALRTPDFEVVTPDGAVHNAAEMEAFSRNLVENVRSWEALSFDVVSIDQQGEDVAVETRQHSIRMQRRSDGNVHRIENWVNQRETWVRTGEGLKVRRVDNIRDQRVEIDGVPRP